MRKGEVVGGRFAILARAGTGGASSVHRARDRLTGKPVALKVIRKKDLDTAIRFEREAAILASLVHPGIVRYVAHGRTAKGARWLATEWIEGTTLADRLARGALGPDETRALAERIAGALALAHERGVVHRDLKPANILLPDGDLTRAAVIDFGIARRARGAWLEGPAREGTPGYVAPEQARGEPRIDARADVFSLGCVLFECLTGRPAFPGLAVLAKIVAADAPRVRSLAPAVPADLDLLVQDMLEKERARRPGDASAVLARLEGATRAARTSTDVAPPPRGFGAAEQRVLSVVLARSKTSPRTLARLRRTVSRAGARLDALADGTLLVALPSASSAKELAARAADIALQLRSVLPHGRIAVASGRAEVGPAAPAPDVVDRGAKALSSGRPGRVHIDDATAGLLGGRFEVAMEGAGLVLTGVRRGIEPPRTLLGQPTPFVGRERDLAALLAIADESAAERVARVVLVTGAQGAGKSRLAFELLSRIGGRFTILSATGHGLAAGEPLALVVDLVRSLAGASSPALAHRTLRARLAQSLPDPERVLAALLPRGRSPNEDPLRAFDERRRAWVELLSAEAAAAPVVLFLDDVDVADRASLDLVDFALRALADRPLFVLAAAKPDALPGVFAERGALEVRLLPLGAAAATRIVRAGLGASASERSVATIAARGEGNPLFLEELVRAARAGISALPDTVLGVVQARLDAEGAAAKRVLRAASVFGERFRSDGVVAIAGGARASVLEWLETLEAREILHRRGDELSFRQSLLWEAAYATLTEVDRRVAHLRAAEWLVSCAEEDPAILAEHFERGGASARAIVPHRRAAERALDANDFDAALDRAARGLRAGASGDEAQALLLVQARAHQWRAEPALAAARAEDAMAGSEPGDEVWCAAAAVAAAAHGRMGQRERLDALAARIADAPGEGATVVAASSAFSWLLFSGETALSERLRSRLEASVASPNPAVAARAEHALAVAALFAGDPAEHRRRAALAAAAFDRAGDARQACAERANLGYGHLLLGEWEAAERVLLDAIAGAEKLGVDREAALARHNLGLVLARLGDPTSGRREEERALEAFVRRGDARLESACRIYLARILFEAGEAGDAEREARAAAERLGPFPPMRADALAVLARILAKEGRAADALAAAREAEASLSRGRAEGSRTQVGLALVESLEAAGLAAQAAAALEGARATLLAEADRIGDAAARQSFLARVPENALLFSYVPASISAHTPK